jgi:hypothetical protein
MKIACYIGSHKKDRLSVRLGWMLVRLVQRGHFCNVTHVEAILAEYDDGTVDSSVAQTMRLIFTNANAGQVLNLHSLVLELV